VFGITTYKIKWFKIKLAKVEDNITVVEEPKAIIILSFVKSSFCSPVNFEEGISSEVFPLKMRKE
jgi:hypothetical protein